MSIDPAAPPPITPDGRRDDRLAELERRIAALERGRLGGGSGAVLLPNASAAPGTPTAGGYFYVSGGALHWKGSAGTDTTVAPA